MDWRVCVGWLSALLLAGCASRDVGDSLGDQAEDGAGTESADDDDDDADPDGTGPGDDDDDDDDDDSSGTTGGEPSVDLCPDDGTWEISMSGVGQDAYEGLSVWLSAVEPAQRVGPHAAVPTVILEDAVTDGSFDLVCPQGISENFVYPSFALVVDADGSGDCTDGDLGLVMQLFGWANPQIYEIDGGDLYSLEGERPWLAQTDAWTAVPELNHSWGRTSFCEYYFPR